MVLEYMQDCGISNRAMFITRHIQGGEMIGTKRFDGYLQAARHAINAKPLNTITNTYQFSWPTQKSNGHHGGHKISKGRRERYDRIAKAFETPEEEEVFIGRRSTQETDELQGDTEADSTEE